MLHSVTHHAAEYDPACCRVRYIMLQSTIHHAAEYDTLCGRGRYIMRQKTIHSTTGTYSFLRVVSACSDTVNKSRLHSFFLFFFVDARVFFRIGPRHLVGQNLTVLVSLLVCQSEFVSASMLLSVSRNFIALV